MGSTSIVASNLFGERMEACALCKIRKRLFGMLANGDCLQSTSSEGMPYADQRSVSSKMIQDAENVPGMVRPVRYGAQRRIS